MKNQAIGNASRWVRGCCLLLAGILLVSTAGCGCKAKPGDTSSEETSSSSSSASSTSGAGGAGSSTSESGTSTSGEGSTTSGNSSGSSSSGSSSGGSSSGGNSSSGNNSSGGSTSGDFKIVEKGQAEAKIVIAAKPSEKVLAAAADLQDYLKRMTGVTVKVVYDSSDCTDGNYILVGPSKYTEKLGIKQPTGYPNNEKVILKRVKNYLVLMGNDDGPFLGTQYAVTMFLEKQGCGWFGTQDLWQVVPSKTSISVGSMDITHTPKFTSRENRVLNSLRDLGERWYLGGMQTNGGGHSLPTLISMNEFANHPDWFAHKNGELITEGNGIYWQYCYSNQSLANEFGKKIIEYFDDHPYTMVFSITANDGWTAGLCECSACSKFSNDAELITTFANRVAKVVAKKYPDRKLSFLSYHSTLLAPKASIKVEPNVEIMFCTETSMTQPIDQVGYVGMSGSVSNVSWKSNFESYVSKTGVKNISIWKWLCLSADSAGAVWQNIPWVQGNVAIEDQNYWKKNGAQYVFYDQGPLAAYRETEASLPLRWPLWYVAAKGMWEPNMTGDQILQDACNKLYGKGADAMLSYYKALADASKQCTAKSHAWVPPSPSAVYTGAQVKKIDAAIAKAESLLNSVSSLEKQRMQNQIKLWKTAKTYL